MIKYSRTKMANLLINALPFITPLLFAADEFSDILYCVLNWNSFANDYLRISAVVSTVMNGLISMLLAAYALCSFKGVNCFNLDLGMIIVFFCLCGWIPILGMFALIFYTKGFELMEHCYGVSSIVENRYREEDLRSMMKCVLYSSMFAEDLPQLILQSINNTLSSQWNALAIVSLSFTVLTLSYGIIRMIYCPIQAKATNLEKLDVYKQESVNSFKIK